MFSEYLDHHDLTNLLCAREGFRPIPRRTERDKWESLSIEKREALLAWGEEAKAGYPMLTATQFLAFSRSGSRLAYETPYFERRRILMGAVLAECVKDDGSFLDAVVDGIWCICEESSWVISAHNGSDHPGAKPMNKRPLPNVTNPYIDLFAAQTSALLSDALYLLEDKLNSVSPLIVRRVRLEIEKRILHPFMMRDDFWWMGLTRHDVCNWTPWIVSNVLVTAALGIQDRLRLASMVRRSLLMVDRWLDVVPEDGGCDEGAGYFNMAGASLLDCLESVFLATDGCVSFYHEPHIRAIGTFPLKAHISGAYFLNFADCDAMPKMDGERIHQYGLRTENEPLAALGAWLHKQDMKVNPPARPLDTPQMHRTLLKLFADIPSRNDEPVHEVFEEFKDLQVFCWRRNGLFAAVKGGHNGENHNHNDVGTLIVYADGEPQIVDMGNKVYTAVTFGPDRYTLDNTRSKNHNVPLIGDLEQHAGRAYGARCVCADEHGASMDIAGAYPASAGVRSLNRSLAVKGDGIEVSDEVQLETPQEITWVFMLRHKPLIAEGSIRFGKLVMAYDPALFPAAEEIPVTDARMVRSFPGSLWRLALRAPACAAHKKTFIITRS